MYKSYVRSPFTKAIRGDATLPPRTPLVTVRGKQAQHTRKVIKMLTAVELAEVARTAIVSHEDRWGKLRPVSDEVLKQWAHKYGVPKLEELLAKEYEVYATHPDFMPMEYQEQLHQDVRDEVVTVLVEGLIARLEELTYERAV